MSKGSLMSLRNITLAAIATTLIGLNAVLYAITSTVLSRHSRTAEDRDTRRTVQAAQNVFRQYENQFVDRWNDWSRWDDSYKFIQDRNQSYIRSNLVDSYFANDKINLVVFADTSGRIVFSRSFDFQNKIAVAIPEELKKHLSVGDLFFRQDSHIKAHRQGIIMLPGGPMLISAQPIVTSTGEGPVRGTIVWGRYLTHDLIEPLTDPINLSLKIQPFNAPKLPDDFALARSFLSGRNSIFIQSLNEQWIAGYTLIRDIYGQPALLVRVDNERAIYQRSKKALRYLMILTLVVGTVFGGVTLLLLEKLVLSRLAYLSNEVIRIGTEGDLSVQLMMPGRDELSRLTTCINEMLKTIEHHQQEQQQTQDALEKALIAAESAQQQSELLLLNILPKEIADELKQNQGALAERGAALAEQFNSVTILFADIVGFTPLASRLSATEVVNLLNDIFSTFDQLAEQHGVEKIKTLGDAYMVAAGLPVPRNDHAEAIAQMALDMQREIASFQGDDGKPLGIRIGINTGPVVAGVIGIRKFIYDLWGDTVNVASRMESQGIPGRIQVTASTYECLKERFLFEARGTTLVKGKGEMTTYWLIDTKNSDDDEYSFLPNFR